MMDLRGGRRYATLITLSEQSATLELAGRRVRPGFAGAQDQAVGLQQVLGAQRRQLRARGYGFSQSLAIGGARREVESPAQEPEA